MAKGDATHSYIGRVDRHEKQLVGWIVQTHREGTRINRFFSDKRYKGRRRAYAAALQFATELGSGFELRALESRLKPRRNSRSGVPGLGRYEGGSGHSPFWVAYWDENGRKVQKKFSIALHGEERARDLAIRARQKAVRPHVKRLAELRKHDARVLRAFKAQQ